MSIYLVFACDFCKVGQLPKDFVGSGYGVDSDLMINDSMSAPGWEVDDGLDKCADCLKKDAEKAARDVAEVVDAPVDTDALAEEAKLIPLTFEQAKASIKSLDLAHANETRSTGVVNLDTLIGYPVYMAKRADLVTQGLAAVDAKESDSKAAWTDEVVAKLLENNDGVYPAGYTIEDFRKNLVTYFQNMRNELL